MPSPDDEQNKRMVSVSRVIDASPEKIFDILASPAGHARDGRIGFDSRRW